MITDVVGRAIEVDVEIGGSLHARVFEDLDHDCHRQISACGNIRQTLKQFYGVIMEPLHASYFLLHLLQPVQRFGVLLSRRDLKLVFVHGVNHETNMPRITFAKPRNSGNLDPILSH